MKRPWLKFYPADWRSDPRLRMCSLAARGLWIDLISYMHEGEPYGHLTINGARPKLDQIASLVGRPSREVEKAFAELVSLGVCSCEGGAIVSRRMVKDNERSEEGREQVNKRWANRLPNRCRDDEPNRSGGSDPKSPPTQDPITQRLDTRTQKEERIPEPSGSGPTQADLEKQLFSRGRQVCGKQSGGLIASLLKSKEHDVALARSVIETASTKHDPREYVAAATRSKTNGHKRSPTMDAFDDLIARAGGEVESDPPMRDITPRGGHIS